jgi:hypothetical protein
MQSKWIGTAAAIVVALSLSSPALGEPYGEPDPTPPPVPNLVVATASVTAVSSTQWEVAFVTRNASMVKARNTTTAIRKNGSTVLATRYVPALDAGASFADKVRVERSGCYIPVELVADYNTVVVESSESNSRWAIGLSSAACTSLPSYRVKATTFYAADESHWDKAGSDEPYFVFSAVGADGTADTVRSRTFGDVDSGESRTFASTEGCIWTTSCTALRAPFGLGLSVQLWEHDYGDMDDIRAKTAEAFGSEEESPRPASIVNEGSPSLEGS